MNRSTFLKSAAGLFATPMLFPLSDIDILSIQERLERDLLELLKNQDPVPYTHEGMQAVERNASQYLDKIKGLFGNDIIIHYPLQEIK